MQKGSKLLKENLITLTLRLPESIIQGIDRDIARRLHEAPGIILHRSDIARDLIVRSLRDRERHAAGPGDAGRGLVLDPVTLGEDQSTDFQDSPGPQAANTKDHERTTGRTGRKRAKALQEGT